MIILANPRSGSGWLSASIAGSIPQCSNCGEILNEDQLQGENPLKAIAAFRKLKNAVGVVHGYQIDNEYDKLCRVLMAGDCFILLKRRNLWEQAVSDVIARSQRIWKDVEFDPGKKANVASAEILEVMAWFSQRYSLFEKTLTEKGLWYKTRVVFYEDLETGARRDLSLFLGIDLKMASTVRQRALPLREYLNPAESELRFEDLERIFAR